MTHVIIIISIININIRIPSGGPHPDGDLDLEWIIMRIATIMFEIVLAFVLV